MTFVLQWGLTLALFLALNRWMARKTAGPAEA